MDTNEQKAKLAQGPKDALYEAVIEWARCREQRERCHCGEPDADDDWGTCWWNISDSAQAESRREAFMRAIEHFDVSENDRRAADLNESERAELERLRAENADLQKTIDEQNDDINMLAEERQRLRALAAKLDGVEMVVPVEWCRGPRDMLCPVAEKVPLMWMDSGDGVEAMIESMFGVIRLREPAGDSGKLEGEG